MARTTSSIRSFGTSALDLYPRTGIGRCSSRRSRFAAAPWVRHITWQCTPGSPERALTAISGCRAPPRRVAYFRMRLTFRRRSTDPPREVAPALRVCEFARMAAARGLNRESMNEVRAGDQTSGCSLHAGSCRQFRGPRGGGRREGRALAGSGPGNYRAYEAKFRREASCNVTGRNDIQTGASLRSEAHVHRELGCDRGERFGFLMLVQRRRWIAASRRLAPTSR